MGLSDGHPEKDGVLVDIKTLSTEIRQRLETIYKNDGVDKELAGKVDELKTEDAGV